MRMFSNGERDNGFRRRALFSMGFVPAFYVFIGLHADKNRYFDFFVLMNNVIADLNLIIKFWFLLLPQSFCVILYTMPFHGLI